MSDSEPVLFEPSENEGEDAKPSVLTQNVYLERERQRVSNLNNSKSSCSETDRGVRRSCSAPSSVLNVPHHAGPPMTVGDRRRR